MWMALTNCPAPGQQRSLRRMCQVSSWALAHSPGDRSWAWNVSSGQQRDPIVLKALVSCHDCQPFRMRLGYEHPVERIVTMAGQLSSTSTCLSRITQCSFAAKTASDDVPLKGGGVGHRPQR